MFQNIKIKINSLVILLLLLVVTSLTGNVVLAETNNSISSSQKETISKTITDNADILFGSTKIEIIDIQWEDGLVKVKIKIDDKEQNIFFTKNNKIIFKEATLAQIKKSEEDVVIGEMDEATGEVKNNEQLKKEFAKFLKENMIKADVEVVVKDIVEEDGLYKITITVQGNDDVLYLTKNGKRMVFQLLGIAEYKQILEQQKKAEKEAATVTADNKNDKPKVDLFVMSYCPYGTQIEKGILPVFKLLGDKIDSKIRFVDYAMHNKKEIDENLLQYCIQKNNPEKYYDYLKCFLKDGKSQQCLNETKLSLNKNNKSFLGRIWLKIKSFFNRKQKQTENGTIADCINKTDKQFKITENYKNKSTWKGQFPSFNIDKQDNEKYKVQGSPTLVVNGQKLSVRRDSTSILQAICSAFKNPPKECQKKLSTESPSAGFGDNKNSNSANGNCGS